VDPVFGGFGIFDRPCFDRSALHTDNSAKIAQGVLHKAADPWDATTKWFHQKNSGRKYTSRDFVSNIDVILFFDHNAGCRKLSGERRKGNYDRRPIVHAILIPIGHQELCSLFYNERGSDLLPDA
jgi:hypothetical protein